MAESWRAILGWEGIYEVSDLGRVRRVYWQPQSVRPREALVATLDRTTGYLKVGLTGSGRSAAKRSVHVLVCEAFGGARPDGLVTRHLNGDRLDNRASNLRWGTWAENQQDTVRHGHHHLASKPTCVRNHRLIPPNLSPSGSGRQCLACGRARAAARHAARQGLVLDVQRLADDHYSRIMGAAA